MATTKKSRPHPKPHPKLEAQLRLLDPLVAKIPEADWSRLACDARTMAMLQVHGHQIPEHARWAFGPDGGELALAALTGEPPAKRIKVPDVLALLPETEREAVLDALAEIGRVIESLGDEACEVETALGNELMREAYERAGEDLRGAVQAREDAVTALSRALDKAKRPRRAKGRRASPSRRSRCKRSA